ncbi:MAG: biotin synthase BioB [bacterium]|nr:biotin synthase BioB [bacterium]
MGDSNLLNLTKRIIKGYEINKDEAYIIWKESQNNPYELFYAAHKINSYFYGKRVDLCAILSIKTGGCEEDCKFCAQSLHYKTNYKETAYLEKDEILRRVKIVKESGIDRIGLVVSGRRIANQKEFDRLSEVIRKIKEEIKIDICVSLGEIDKESARKLKNIGILRYNHNLETSSSYYSQMCTTHEYNDRVKTVKVLKEVGISVCCGGILGMGESIDDRISLALSLRELDVDVVPLNFLNPVAGTPLAEIEMLKPQEALRLIALFRIMLPKKKIKICGGREVVLRDLQSYLFYVGGNGMIVGDYLTTKGRSIKDDLQMIKDLELEV